MEELQNKYRQELDDVIQAKDNERENLKERNEELQEKLDNIEFLDKYLPQSEQIQPLKDKIR